MKWIGLFALVCMLFVTACKDESKPVASKNGGTSTSQDKVRVVIETKFGDDAGEIELELYPKIKPITVDNFLAHIKRGTFRKSSFHRVSKGFMIQGGKPADGNKNFTTIPGEFGKIKHERGVISMARSNSPNSATSEFFIMHKANTNLDRAGYAAFGKVVRGMDVVDRIANLPVVPFPEMGGELSKPTSLIQIVDIRILDKP